MAGLIEWDSIGCEKGSRTASQGKALYADTLSVQKEFADSLLDRNWSIIELNPLTATIGLKTWMSNSQKRVKADFLVARTGLLKISFRACHICVYLPADMLQLSLGCFRAQKSIYIVTLDFVKKTHAYPNWVKRAQYAFCALSCRCSPNCLLGNGVFCTHTKRGTIFWEILTFSLFCMVSSHNSPSQ